MSKGKKGSLVLPERVVSRIFLVRGQKVVLDADLAELYGVTTKRLNEQVRRNIDRFPADFMFRLNARKYRSLRSQFATLKQGRGEHRKYLPFVFTEHGAVMAASVLDSERAVQVSIYVVRAFVQLREMLSSNKQLAQSDDPVGTEEEASHRFRSMGRQVVHGEALEPETPLRSRTSLITVPRRGQRMA